MTDLVKPGITACSCGKELKPFAVDIGCVYETEPFDNVDLYAVDVHEAGEFCEGYETVHDIIYFQYLFSGKERPEEKRHEGLHREVPKVETSPAPRHPFFFREQNSKSGG